MTKNRKDARVIARLDEEEQVILRRARFVTGQNTSEVIKAALRLYSQSLPREPSIQIFERCGVVGAISGPTDLSESYKQHIDYSAKHGKG